MYIFQLLFFSQWQQAYIFFNKSDLCYLKVFSFKKNSFILFFWVPVFESYKFYKVGKTSIVFAVEIFEQIDQTF